MEKIYSKRLLYNPFEKPSPIKSTFMQLFEYKPELNVWNKREKPTTASFRLKLLIEVVISETWNFVNQNNCLKFCIFKAKNVKK